MCSFVSLSLSLLTNVVSATNPAHNVVIEWLFPWVLTLPFCRCADFPSVLGQCCNPFDFVLLLFHTLSFFHTLYFVLSYYFMHFVFLFSLCCCSKGMRSLIHHRYLHRMLALYATYNEFGVDCRTINSHMPFCDPTHETIYHCTCSITSHVSVWIDITSAFVVVVLLPRLFLALRFKKTRRAKKCSINNLYLFNDTNVLF